MSRSNPHDIVEILFTSGATAEPKGVLINHRNIHSNLITTERIISRYVKWFRPVFPLRFLNLVPLSHMFGQPVAMLPVPLEWKPSFPYRSTVYRFRHSHLEPVERPETGRLARVVALGASLCRCLCQKPARTTPIRLVLMVIHNLNKRPSSLESPPNEPISPAC